MSDMRKDTENTGLNGEQIVELASAYYSSAVLFAALKCGIFEALKTGQQFSTENTEGAAEGVSLSREGLSLTELAEGLSLNERGLRLLLDGCVAVGLLLKEQGRYRNTPAGESMLVPGARHDLTQAIRYNQDVYSAWGKLAKLAATGKPVEKPEIHLGVDPERTRRFVLSMYGRAMGIGKSVVPMIDIRGARQLLDVGGGSAAYSILLAQSNPELRATVVDLPAVVAVADEMIMAADLRERIETVAGDYHTTQFPDGQDVVIFFGVLHQESPDNIKKLLAKTYRALKPGGKVFVLDMMCDSSYAYPPFSALFAINMALTTDDGWVFSWDDMNRWMEEAGFEDIERRSAPPPMPHILMEARKG